MKLFYSLIIIVCFFWSCQENTPVPKPRMYPRVTFPQKEFQLMDVEECPFQMQKPVYAIYQKDSLKTQEEASFSCWFDLYVEALNAIYHFSYISFDNRQGFDKLVADAFEMADKHNIKASYRDEINISFPEKSVYGLIFEIDGPVASPLQFYLTDSTHHFLRGSLYFNDVVDRDSIKPVYEFMKSDLNPMLESFEWK